MEHSREPEEPSLGREVETLLATLKTLGGNRRPVWNRNSLAATFLESCWTDIRPRAQTAVIARIDLAIQELQKAQEDWHRQGWGQKALPLQSALDCTPSARNLLCLIRSSDPGRVWSSQVPRGTIDAELSGLKSSTRSVYASRVLSTLLVASECYQAWDTIEPRYQLDIWDVTNASCSLWVKSRMFVTALHALDTLLTSWTNLESAFAGFSGYLKIIRDYRNFCVEQRESELSTSVHPGVRASATPSEYHPVPRNRAQPQDQIRQSARYQLPARPHPDNQAVVRVGQGYCPHPGYVPATSIAPSGSATHRDESHGASSPAPSLDPLLQYLGRFP